jgi:hypothetical protein
MRGNAVAALHPDIALLSLTPDYEHLERQISAFREREDHAAAGALFPPLQALIDHAATLRASTLAGLCFKSRMALFCRFPDDDDELLESIARDLLAMEGGL